MSSTKQQKLDQIKAEIIKNNVCPNLAKTAKHLVFGEGNPDAAVMFIGEAPGKKEDESGKPFVGAAGKFLSELLEGIGLKREDAYITSILKYRPPNNRDPKPEEKDEFWPYLQAQLETIKPKVLVTLGRHSTNCFLPDLHIGKSHGKAQKWAPQTAGDGHGGTPKARSANEHFGGRLARQDPHTFTVLPLYHPAAALYNGRLRQIIIDDFSVIPTLLK